MGLPAKFRINMPFLLFLLFCILHQHTPAKVTNDLKEHWSSGIIDSNLLILPQSHEQQSESLTFFGSLSSFFVGGPDKTERDNFIQARLPVIKNHNLKMERILFVSPHIILKDAKAVKETFVQLYCGLLGILLNSQDIFKMQNCVGFFLPTEPCQILRRCLEQFENRSKMKLEVAMIDARPDCLPSEFIKEFKERRISLYKHPFNMSKCEIFYIRNDEIKGEEMLSPPVELEEEEISPSWIEEFRQISSLHQQARPFRILQRYPLIVSKEECALEDSLREVEQRKIRAYSEEYVRQLEPIYGQFDEIHIEENVEKENCKNDETDSETEEYEFIKLEDYLV